MMDVVKIIIPFLLGLIPFFLNLAYSRKVQEENAIQQYRIKFYEKQIDALSKFSIQVTDFQNAMYHKYSVFGLAKGSDLDSSTVGLLESANKNGGESLLILHKMRDEYEYLMPYFLLSKVDDYLKIAIKYFYFSEFKENKDIMEHLNIPSSVTEFSADWKVQCELFHVIKFNIRMIIGVEGLSEKIVTQVKKNNNQYSFGVRDYEIDIFK